MSNYRKVIKRRDHFERVQPENRQKLGFLEKHRDYVKRAQNFHSKEDRLNALKAAARLRNPDEFYHRMERKTEHIDDKGRHVILRDTQKNQLSGAQMKRLKTQDRNYLLMQKQQELSQIDALRANLQGIDALESISNPQSSSNKRKHDEIDDWDDEEDDDGDDKKSIPIAVPAKKHVIFTDSVDAAKTFDSASHFNTLPELVSRSHNRLTKDQLASKSVISNPVTPKNIDAIEREQARAYRKIVDRTKRLAVVDERLTGIEKQRLLMGKGRRVKTTVRDEFGDVDESKTVFRWKLQRKK
jgi:U3 small nucleolar RNA-associated protein 11